MSGQAIYFEDIELADELTPLPIRLTKERLRVYTGLRGLNQLGWFTDEEAAKKAGRRTIHAPGDMILGLMARMLTEWGGQGSLRKLEANYRDFLYIDEDLTCCGIVTDKYTRDDQNFVECDVYFENQDGEKLATGRGVVALPSRS